MDKTLRNGPVGVVVACFALGVAVSVLACSSAPAHEETGVMESRLSDNPPEKAAPSPSGECKTLELSAKDCDTLKEQVLEACSGGGLTLNDLSTSDCTGGAPVTAKATCCSSVPSPPPLPMDPTKPAPDQKEPPLPEPPPAPACELQAVKANTCLDAKSLWEQAADACKQEGLAIGAVKPVDACADNASFMAVEFCCSK